MLKKFFLLTVLSVFSSNLFAHGNEWIAAAVLIKDTKWTPIQISVWPVHLCSPRTDVYGLAVSPGLVGFADKVYGISSGIIFLQNENFGVTAGIYSFGVKNRYCPDSCEKSLLRWCIAANLGPCSCVGGVE